MTDPDQKAGAPMARRTLAREERSAEAHPLQLHEWGWWTVSGKRDGLLEA